MTGLLATIISVSTLVRLVAYALVAGLGVMAAFSALIYCVDRALTLQRADRRSAAVMFQAGSVLAMATVAGIVIFGLVLISAKPK